MDCPDLNRFSWLDELGLEVTGQLFGPRRVVLACRVWEPDQWCGRCGCEVVSRESVGWALARELFGGRPTTLLVTIRRYRCTGRGHVWRQHISLAAEPRAKLSRRGLWWALEGLAVQHLTVARVARGWGRRGPPPMVLTEGKWVLIDDPTRFDGVKDIGLDEHCGAPGATATSTSP